MSKPKIQSQSMMDPDLLHIITDLDIRQESEDLSTHIRQLADSILSVGVCDPLTVTQDGDGYGITNGTCRKRAIDLIKSEGGDVPLVPVVLTDETDEGTLTVGLLIHNSGRPLTQLEKSAAVRRALSFGLTHKRISEMSGLSERTVYNLDELDNLDPEVKDRIADGDISATEALRVAQKVGKDNASGAITSMLDHAKGEGRTRATQRDLKASEKGFGSDVDKETVARLASDLGIKKKNLSIKDGYISLTIRNLDEPALITAVDVLILAGIDITG